jgi:hypothetical protein
MQHALNTFSRPPDPGSVVPAMESGPNVPPHDGRTQLITDHPRGRILLAGMWHFAPSDAE